MKKTVSIILCLLMIVSVVPIIGLTASAEKSGYYTYSVSNGEATITDCSTSISGDITIPSTLGGYSVTSIGSYSFRNCTSLTSIVIPDSVTSIDRYAFSNCKSLTSITIGNGVTSIGYDAFSYCTSLTSIVIPDSVTSIGSYSFRNCKSLTSLNIPNSVTSIGSSAFWGCTSLTSIVIPDSVTSIGREVFYNCKSLTSLNIPNSVTSIGEGAFAGCSTLISINVDENNKRYCDVGGVLFNKDKTTILAYPNSKATTYSIPNSVTTIGWYAFTNCTSLTSITIPDSIIRIDEDTFAGCSSLTSVTIPNSVTSIGEGAFAGCSSLKSITIGNGVTSIGEDAFENCTSLNKVNITDVAKWCQIGFGDCVFSNPLYYAKNLYLNNKLVANLIIPNDVTSIGYLAFYNCTSLTSITIPDSVTSIGYLAFYNCKSLKKISVSKNNKNYCDLDGVLFNKDKTNLIQYPAGNTRTAYIIPNSITSIGFDAFYNCKSLKKISVSKNNKNYCDIDGVLFNKDKTTLIQYPIGNTRTSYTIPNSVKTIDDNAFYNCTSLSSITIPDSVTSIWTGAFYNCTSLKAVIIGKKVKTISYDAFYNCTSLTSVTIPDSVTDIGRGAFYNCTSLTSVTIPNSVRWIGKEAFGYYNRYGKTYKIPTFIIIGNKFTEAEEYAAQNNFNFQELCNSHVYTKGTLQKSTYFSTGIALYECENCGNYYIKAIAKLKLKTPKTTIKSGKKYIKVSYTKVSGATGFQVKYVIGSKSVTNTFKTSKSTSKTINKLQKGYYKVYVRAYVQKGNEKVYSSWTKAKSVKVK